MKHEVVGDVPQSNPTLNEIVEAVGRAIRSGQVTDDVLDNPDLFNRIIDKQLVEKS